MSLWFVSCLFNAATVAACSDPSIYTNNPNEIKKNILQYLRLRVKYVTGLNL